MLKSTVDSMHKKERQTIFLYSSGQLCNNNKNKVTYALKYQDMCRNYIKK